jgi:hypothetical protein
MWWRRVGSGGGGGLGGEEGLGVSDKFVSEEGEMAPFDRLRTSHVRSYLFVFNYPNPILIRITKIVTPNMTIFITLLTPDLIRTINCVMLKR